MERVNTIERILYIVLFLVVLAGVYFGFANQDFFTNNFAKEDGAIENATAAFLLMGSILMIRRLFVIKNRAGLWFIVTTAVVALAFLFVAGEEISWGQRIFNVESSEFFSEYNAQGETNLHNLTVGDVKINKLVFGKILTGLIILYLIVGSMAFRKSTAVKKWMDRMAVPVSKYHPIIAYVITSFLITIIPASRNSELLEFASAVIFFMILLFPYNKYIYSLSHYKKEKATVENDNSEKFHKQNGQ